MITKTPDSVRVDRERAKRLEIARRLFKALVAKDPDRVIILHDGSGRMVAHHDLQPEHPEVAS
jgi:hypothetical protein